MQLNSTPPHYVNQQNQLLPDRTNAEGTCTVKVLNSEEIFKYKHVFKSILETWQKNLNAAFENKTGRSLDIMDFTAMTDSLLWFESSQTVLSILELIDSASPSKRYVTSINTVNNELEAIGVFEVRRNVLTIDALATNPKNFHDITERIATNKPSIKGAGSLVIQKMIEIGKNEAAIRIKLTSSISATGFYEKSGFVRVPGTENDFSMPLNHVE